MEVFLQTSIDQENHVQSTETTVQYKCDERVVLAATNGNLDEMKLLYAQAVIDWCDYHNVMMIAAKHDHLNILQFLYSTLEILQSSHCEDIYTAASNADIATMRFLLDMDEEVKSINVYCRHVVKSKEVADYIDFIDERIYASHEQALLVAVEKGYDEVVCFLLARGVDATCNNDYALRTACKNGNDAMASFIIRAGGNVRTHNNEPIKSASGNGHLRVVDVLISRGADVKANSDYAVRMAAKNGHLKIVSYLHSRGADIRAKNDEALRYAIRNGHLELTKWIRSKYPNANVGNGL